MITIDLYHILAIMVNMNAINDLMTIENVAAEFNVSTTTVRRWIRRGLLDSVRTKPIRGDRLVTRASVERFRRETMDQR